jgi:hypothetical protein
LTLYGKQWMNSSFPTDLRFSFVFKQGLRGIQVLTCVSFLLCVCERDLGLLGKWELKALRYGAATEYRKHRDTHYHFSSAVQRHALSLLKCRTETRTITSQVPYSDTHYHFSSAVQWHALSLLKCRTVTRTITSQVPYRDTNYHFSSAVQWHALSLLKCRTVTRTITSQVPYSMAKTAWRR